MKTPKSESSPVKTNTSPLNRLVAGEPLRFGIDVDGTLTQAPRHFKYLIDALLAHGDELYIITGRREALREETRELLGCLGINYTELIMRPNDWSGTVAQFKVAKVREKKVHLMIDSDAENCWAIQQQTSTLAANMLPIPETPEAREAKTRLSQGNCDGKLD